MSNYEAILKRIIADERYKKGIKYGKPRRGHQEGSVAAHIDELEGNLNRLADLLSSDDFWKLKVLIHTHDTMKRFSRRDVPIDMECSHASMARAFLSEFTDDTDLQQMVWFHDENFAAWKKMKKEGSYDVERFFKRIIEGIRDHDLFLMFTIVDGATESKLALAGQEKPDKLRWFIEEVARYRSVPRAFAALTIFGL